MAGNHFRTNQFSSSSAAPMLEQDESIARIVKNQAPLEREVEDFHFQRLNASQPQAPQPQAPQPQAEKEIESDQKASEAGAERFFERGAEITEPKSRFRLSELTREALGLAADEKRRVEHAVSERVAVEAELARAIGVKEGYAEGLEKGRADALLSHGKSLEERMKRLDGLLESMEAAKESVFDANKKFLIDLCFRVSRMVLLRELVTDREYVTRLARELVERMGLRDHLILKVNPSDFALLDEIRGGLESAFGEMRNLAIEPSAEVRGGGAILETEWGAIDASLDTQLANLQAALQAPLQAPSREGV